MIKSGKQLSGPSFKRHCSVFILYKTILGPRDLSHFNDDFVPGYKGKPDIVKELAHFAKNPFNPTEDLHVETLISFSNFNALNIAELGNGVIVRKED